MVYLLLPATYANGWLGYLSASTISKFTQYLSHFNWVMKMFTLSIECGVLLFFLQRRLTVVLLLGCIFFQLGIFITTGINFWSWMLINSVLLFLFIRKDAFVNLPVFKKSYFVISLLLILGSPVWFHPVNLSWMDVPLNYTYKFEATTTNGNKFMLPPAFFSPYDYQFTLGGFQYAVNKKVLPIVWGITRQLELAKWLQVARTPEQVFEYEATKGYVFYDIGLKNALEKFLQRYIHNWNQNRDQKRWVKILQPPRLLWTFPRNTLYQPEVIIKKIEIVQVTSYYADGKYTEIRSVPVGSVTIPLIG